MSKSETFKIRLSKKEMQMLKFYAKQNEMTISEYIRRQTIGYAEVYTKPVTASGIFKKFKLKE